LKGEIVTTVPSIDFDEDFYIGKKINETWCILETAPTAYQAFKARNLLLQQDQRTGLRIPETDYRVFRKGYNEIQYNIEDRQYEINK
jgi:hypothetical protein